MKAPTMTVIIKYAFLLSFLNIYHVTAKIKNIRTADVPSWEITVKKDFNDCF